MSDIAQRVAARLKPRFDKKAWEPDEWYPTREQEQRELEEYGCLGPDGTGCPKGNLSDDPNTRLCDECDAAIKAASLEKYVPWDELEECCPEIYNNLDNEFERLRQEAGNNIASWDDLDNFPQVVDAAEKLRENLLQYVQRAKKI